MTTRFPAGGETCAVHVVCPAGIVQERANPTGSVGSWALAGKPRVRVGTRIAKAAATKLLRSFMGGLLTVHQLEAQTSPFAEDNWRRLGDAMSAPRRLHVLRAR